MPDLEIAMAGAGHGGAPAPAVARAEELAGAGPVAGSEDHARPADSAAVLAAMDLAQPGAALAAEWGDRVREEIAADSAGAAHGLEAVQAPAQAPLVRERD